jgi:hypothetical protein
MRLTSGINFGYDLESVKWLDGYINRMRTDPSIQASRSGLVQTLGSYLGEAIIRTYGGEWQHPAGYPEVRFDEKNAAFPFVKVEKQLLNGPEDSIASFFSMLPIIIPTLKS